MLKKIKAKLFGNDETSYDFNLKEIFDKKLVIVSNEPTTNFLFYPIVQLGKCYNNDLTLIDIEEPIGVFFNYYNQSNISYQKAYEKNAYIEYKKMFLDGQKEKINQDEIVSEYYSKNTADEYFAYVSQVSDTCTELIFKELLNMKDRLVFDINAKNFLNLNYSKISKLYNDIRYKPSDTTKNKFTVYVKESDLRISKKKNSYIIYFVSENGNKIVLAKNKLSKILEQSDLNNKLNLISFIKSKVPNIEV